MLIAEMAQYLQDMNLGVFEDVLKVGTIYLYTMPSTPDQAICLYDRGGTLADGKLGYDPVDIEILVRGSDVILTQQLAQHIYNTLHGFHNKSFVDGGIYIINCLAAQGAPNYIGKNQGLQFEFTLNFNLEIKNFEGGRNNGDY
jgi:hypothetical protein